MRQVMHIVYSGLGGIANVFFSLAQANPEDNYVHCVAFYGDKPTSPHYIAECNKLGIEHATFVRNPRFDFQANKSLHKWMLKCQPEIIIVHLPRALPAAVKFKRHRPNTAVIGVEHNPLNLKRSVDWLDSIKLQQQCDAVVFLNNSYLNKVKNKLGRLFSSKKSHVISNGIDTSLFRKQGSTHREKNTISFGMCSRLTTSKDIETLIKAMALIKNMELEYSCKLYIAGDGPNRTALNKQVANNGLETDIFFNGTLNENELIDWFETIDIYVHATQSEVMSTSIMQAMSFSLPIVSNNVDGMKELVPSNCGLLSEPKNEQALAKNMMLYASDRRLRQVSGAASREHAINKLSKQLAWSNYSKLIESLI